MKVRRPASIVQLAVFVIGGILGPVWHLAHHQNDHTHGAVPSLASIDVAGESHSHTSSAARPVTAARLAHTHPAAQPNSHHHPEASDHAPLVAEGPHEHAAPAESESSPPQTPLDHGRGSVAHLGLVLLGAPALLPVPLPERSVRIVVVGAVAALSLFDSPCPLQRPPPARIT